MAHVSLTPWTSIIGLLSDLLTFPICSCIMLASLQVSALEGELTLFVFAGLCVYAGLTLLPVCLLAFLFFCWGVVL